jgi:beta-glucosidase
MSLIPVLARSYDERTSLTGWRMGASLVVSLVGIAAPPAVVLAVTGDEDLASSDPLGWIVMAGLLAAITLVGLVVSLLAVRVPDGGERVARQRLSRALLGRLWRLPPLRSVLLILLVYYTAIIVGTATLPFYLESVLDMDAGQQSIVLGGFFLVTVLSIPLATSAARRLGKTRALAASTLVYCVGLMLFAVVQPRFDQVPQLLLVIAVAGVGFSGAVVLPNAMVPDVAEFIEDEMGERRESLLYTLATFFVKTGGSIGVALVAGLTSLIGYQAGQSAQSDGTQLGLALIVGPFQALLYLLGAWLAWRSPLTRSAFHALADRVRPGDAAAPCGARERAVTGVVEPSDLAARLPRDFLLGAATAAYQVEGAWDADGKGLSVWDVFVRQPGTVERGERADDACRSYERWRDDAALCAELGLDAYRFSVSWPRIQPRGPAVNAAGLDHYDRFVDALVEAGVRPVLTLHHWDLPQWLQDRGGWTARETAQRFADYAGIVGERFGDRVHLWATHNEPWVVAVAGHMVDVHPPGFDDPALGARAVHHLLLAHGLGVQALRAAGVQGGIGIVLSEAFAEPADPESEQDHRAAELGWDFFGRLFRHPVLGRDYPASLGFRDALPVQDGDLATIAQPLDFLGVNNYTRELCSWAPEERLGFARVRGDLPRTEMDWEIAPHGIGGVLRRLQQEHGDALPPVYVTENGMADTLDPVDGRVRDDDRIAFLASYLSSVLDARDDGVDVRGYVVWSLLDNFEWSFGYRPRFGLVHVDHATGERTVKDSGRWWAEVSGPSLTNVLRRRLERARVDAHARLRRPGSSSAGPELLRAADLDQLGRLPPPVVSAAPPDRDGDQPPGNSSRAAQAV